jgi:hypothetical protein
MSSVLSQDAWTTFLNDSLNADTSASSEAEQRQEYINQSNQLYNDTVEQAKSAAMDAGINLIGISGIEAVGAVKGLYTAGQKLYTRVQQMKDISKKIIAQKDARTAKIQDLKEQKFNEAQAKNAEIDDLTGLPKGPVLDKATFMADADKAISKAGTEAIISKVRGIALEKASPFIDSATQSANNLIDAIGSRADSAVASLTSTATRAGDFLKNGFAQYTDTANQLKADYLDNFSRAKTWTDSQLTSNITRGTKEVEKFASDSAAKGIEGIDEHLSTVRDLISQGTRQSVAQAGTLFKNLKENVKAVAPYEKIKKAQADIEDVKVGVAQQKADVLNNLKETRDNIVDKIDLATQRLEQARTLPEGAAPFRNAGVSKSEVLDGIQSDIDNHNLDLQNKIGEAHGKLGDIDIAASQKVADLTDQIGQHSDAIVDAAGGATTDLLTRLNTGLSSAVSTAGDAITAVRSAVAPVTDLVGAVLTPVAVWQGALSAENIIKGQDNGNLENLASDAVNVRFGVGAAKSVVSSVAQKVKGVIGGEQNAATTAEQSAERDVTNIGKTEAQQGQEVASGALKSEGTAAGEDIASGLAEAGGEDIAEIGLGDLALNAIPVVGEIADVAMVGFSLYEGLKGLFGGGSSDTPPPPPPPPAITQSVSFHGQAGVY